MNLVRATNRLEVYTEATKKKTFVGELWHDEAKKAFKFKYDTKYFRSKGAVPLGPDLKLSKKIHTSSRLFDTFADRIPSKTNPAYADYCKAQGISPKESNPIILLTTIGRKGPSTFVFEPTFEDQTDIPKVLEEFRKKLDLSLEDFAKAFELNTITVHRIEKRSSKDRNIMRLIDIYLTYPQVALEELEFTRKYVHHKVYSRLVEYFERQKKKA
ncbi:MAG: HipA N-terminal domain-containing protein [Bdellovibrionota bacterium]